MDGMPLDWEWRVMVAEDCVSISPNGQGSASTRVAYYGNHSSLDFFFWLKLARVLSKDKYIESWS